MTAPLETTGSEPPLPDTAGPIAGVRIEGRSLGQIAWQRFKRDRAAFAGAVVIAVFVVLAVAAPLFGKILGTGPNDYHDDAIDPVLTTPKGSFGGMSWAHPLGVEPVNGRDLFMRVLYGARVSLVVAFLATALSVIIGVTLGVVAGYFGGWIDSVISRLMDIFLAFPLLLFAIALGSVLQGKAFGMTGDTLHIAVLIFVIGFFNWPYIGRIVRGQTLSLREREFVDAARSMGARNGYILVRELLPNLAAPILVYSTLIVPTNILFEAALSFLGVGVQPPTASWGGMLSQAVDHYADDPMFMIVPGVAIFATVLAFNLLGDGLRDALDPRTR